MSVCQILVSQTFWGRENHPHTRLLQVGRDC